ncbi:hypothetical protein CBR_g64826 [Chara braunii]|uniref:Peptidase A2 domain-containing protein n=1 Tax=Chara braunii TaxID=69332 RepID=A0A388K953_CHABU|nr:hypothetical protein CBR_g64826 [Chara braunii]|eukprot:GBG66556.1 hypothetical protein CBR_g64826 [Chara braunii]
MEEVVGGTATQADPDIGEPEKVYGKPREEEPTDKVTVARKKFRYQIPILTMPEIDDTLSKLLGTMVSVSFQTMLQASPRLLKRLRQLLTRRRVEIDENLELQEKEKEEEAPQEVANLQRSPGDLEDLEKDFADIRSSLLDREGGEVMRAPPGTKLSFHALPVGKLKVQIGTHHTDALVDEGAKITLIRKDFTTITGCVVNKEVMGSIRGAGGEIPFSGTLKNTIVKLAADNLGSWPRYLKQAVFSANMTPKRTTGCIPTEIWYGRGIDFPMEALIPTWNSVDDDPRMTAEELIEARCQRVLRNKEAMEDIANRVLDSKMRDKTRWDQVENIRKEPLQVGETVLEVIKISSGDERDEISRPREEKRPPVNQQREGSSGWEDEFGPTPSHWFEQWISVVKHGWIIKVRQLVEVGVAATPLDFYSEMELREIAQRKREILASGLGVKKSVERQDGQGAKQDGTHDSKRD